MGCQHHWLIDPPNGPTATGTCRLCGETREFPNSHDYDTWQGKALGAGNRGRRSRGIRIGRGPKKNRIPKEFREDGSGDLLR